MDHLSSCYFCGTALDEPLQQYRFGKEDAETTVTLCPACKHKLETVFGLVGVESMGQPVAPEGDGVESAAVEFFTAAPGDRPKPAKSATTSETLLSDEDDSPPQSVSDTSDGNVEGDSNDDAEADNSDAEAPADDQVTAENEAESEITTEASGVGGDESGADSPEPTGESVESTASVDDLVDPAVIQADELSEQSAELDEELEAEIERDLTGTSDEKVVGDESMGENKGETDEDDHTGSPADSADDDGRTIDDLLEENMEADMPDEFAVDEANEESPSTAADTDGDSPTVETDTEDEITADSTDATVTDLEQPESPSETDSEDSPESDDNQTEQSDDETSSAEQSPADDDEPARTTISALEYNKVMRLLQNREFPVERSEIETVAASAYNLSEHECAEVIDLAVDRDLLEESDGMLMRPS